MRNLKLFLIILFAILKSFIKYKESKIVVNVYKFTRFILSDFINKSIDLNKVFLSMA